MFLFRLVWIYVEYGYNCKYFICLFVNLIKSIVMLLLLVKVCNYNSLCDENVNVECNIIFFLKLKVGVMWD